VEGSQDSLGENQARVRMVAQPRSMPFVRRFVGDALTDWGRESLIDDVSLCVTELSTNATLHSASQFFEVELRSVAESVRVAVLDNGRAAADSLAAKAHLRGAVPGDLSADDASTTGRGMFLVSALASSWGIDELPGGTRVWAEFTPETSYDARPPEVTRSDGHPRHEVLNPDDWFVVRFIDCPAALLLQHDDNLAEFIRELQLIGISPDRSPSEKLADLLNGHVQKHAINWDAARLMAHEAVREGREFTDIDVLAPKNVVDDIRFLRRLIDEAEAMSVAGELITLPAGPDTQGVRDWLESEFIAQAESGSQPVPYPAFLANRY